MFPKNVPSGASLALALVAILSAPLPGNAADKTVLRPVLDVEQGWDSNVSSASGSDEASLITRVSPSLWLVNSGERGHARLGVTAVGRSIWRETDLSGIDSGARVDFERRLTSRLSVLGDAALDYYSGYEQYGDQTDASGRDLLLSEQPAWKTDRIGAGLSYRLSPRLNFRLNGSAGRVNYERVDPIAFTSGGVPVGNQTGYYRDRSLFDASAALQYQLTSLDGLSLAIDGNNTTYQDLGTGTNDSSIWNTRVGWSRSWSQFWSTSATIGVRGIDATQDDVPQSAFFCSDPNCFGGETRPLSTDANFSSSGTGAIGSLAIERTFARSVLRLSYDRDTRSTGGASRTNFDIDSFRLSLTHQLAERVKLSLVGDYSFYESVSDELPNYTPRTSGNPCPAGGSLTNVTDPSSPYPVFQCSGGSSEESQEYSSLFARIDWQMRRQLTAYLVARYYTATTDQKLASGTSIQTEDEDKFTFGVGFRYAWDLGL